MLKKVLILLFFMKALTAILCAQEQKNVDPNLDEKGNLYINRQDKAFLSEINKSLNDYPPQYPLQRERYLSLLLLDAVLHDPYAAFRNPVKAFFQQRMENALTQLENSKVKNGAMIWKLYNMGFIVRTKTVTIAFDLVRGNSSRSKGFELSDAIMKRFADQCDILFISHKHYDHVDMGVAKEFIKQGKPLIAPPQVWKDEDIYSQITHLKRDASLMQELMLKNGQKLKMVIYPGHQMSKTENNVSLVFTPEGLSFCHMGDQINEGNFMIDYDWIDNVHKHHKVDVLMPSCWTNEIYRIVQGFDPQLVIPGHENELGHPVDDRVPFWDDSEFLELTYPELKKSDYPLLLMTWGESYHYFPKK